MGFVRDITGRTAADAARKGGDLQAGAGREAAGDVVQAGQQAGALLDPFAQIGQQGIDQAGFLTDQQAQFDFLQNNPLFQMGLDNANTQTNQMAAARGRLSAGDTLQKLNNNALLTAAPLIQQQKQSIGDLLAIGQNTALNQGTILQGTAANQGNLLTGAAAAQAGGIVGQGNARGAGSMNILGLGAEAGGYFSDPSLKTNINIVDYINGYNVYTWDWNAKAFLLGLFGSSRGVMANEVLKQNPEAITLDRGYMKVNYSMIGVDH